MKYDIKDTKGEVLFTAEIDCDESAIHSYKKRLAVLWAIKNGKSLKGANLEGANLEGANLWGANLWGAKLSGAKLSGADLWGTDLRWAKVTGKQLGEAIFYGDVV